MNTGNVLSISFGVILAMFSMNAFADSICGRSICGCWEDVNLTYTIKVSDENKNPLKNIHALCENETVLVGKSNASGVVNFSIKNKVSSGCGFQRCGTINIIDPANKFEEGVVNVLKHERSPIVKNITLKKRGYSQALGKIYPDPKHTNPAFKPHDLPFQLPTPFTCAKSVEFYAIILKTLPKCTMTEAERKRVQALFPKHKVFYADMCSGDYKNLMYTNVNDGYDFLAVYAGENMSQARKLATQVTQLGGFAGHNIRKMQAIAQLP